MNGHWIRISLMGALLLAIFASTGCSTQAKRVECDWQLKPINAPAKAKAPAP